VPHRAQSEHRKQRVKTKGAFFAPIRTLEMHLGFKTFQSALGRFLQVIWMHGSYRKVDRLILNPKAISAGELYEKFNLLPNEWLDGIVSKPVRECVIGSGKA
jgi:hypothetical protein